MIAPPRMNVGSVLFATWLAVVTVAAGVARVPEWAKPHLSADATGFADTDSALLLFESADVRYITPDRIRRIYRGILRVRTEPGRAEAKCVYPFNPDTEKVISANAWVVSPDGRRSDDFSTSQFTQSPLHVGRHYWTQQRVIGLVAQKILVGGALAWEFQIESQTGISDINWTFRSGLPVLLSAIEVTPFAGAKLEWHATDLRIEPPVPGAAPGGLRWERRRLRPPAGDRPERFLPEPQWLSIRVASADGRSRSWADIAAIASAVIEPRIVVSPDVQRQADVRVAGKTSRWERIRALTEFVQKDIAYLAVSIDKDYLAGYRPHMPSDVLKNRYGDCKDKSALLAALLRAIGEEANVVLVHAGNPKTVRADWPAAVFNHAIVGLTAGDAVPARWPVTDAGPNGRLVLFDPTDAFTPLGVLSSGVQAGHGLVASPKAVALVALPPSEPETNSYLLEIDATIDEAGALTARAQEKACGVVGVTRQAMRATVNQEQFKRALETRVGETIPFLQHLAWSNEWQPEAAEWRMSIEFRADRYVRRTAGNIMLLNPQILGSVPRMTPWRTNEDGLAWVAPGKFDKRMRFSLPTGAAIEEMPEELTLQCAVAHGRITYRRAADALIVSSELTQKAAFLGRRDYEELRTLTLKLNEAERRPILLRRGGGLTK